MILDCISSKKINSFVYFQRGTYENLDWLKSVKKSHGSVEVNSLCQAEAINAGGVYVVGYPEADTSTKKLVRKKIRSFKLHDNYKHILSCLLYHLYLTTTCTVGIQRRGNNFRCCVQYCSGHVRFQHSLGNFESGKKTTFVHVFISSILSCTHKDKSVCRVQSVVCPSSSGQYC